jgi:acyl-CoA thioesterase FadM
MYPYLRLIKIATQNLFRRQFVGINNETSTTFRVWPLDLDTNMHMNNGRYLTMLDLARFDFMGKVGVLKPVLKRGWFPVLGAAQMVYLKSLKSFQKYTIYTTLEYWDEKWFIMAQRFESNGIVYAYGLVRGLLRNKKGNVTPEEVLALAGYKNIQSPHPSTPIQLWISTLMSYKK